ncbi:MAG: CHASE2 domain-containing protein, partial [Synechococcales bacterium]|nr:CHASE2 domain-containing protein [Synechococcales bacterium]
AKQVSQRWYVKVVPGLIGIGVVVAARFAGLLQPLEWAALDAGLRWRPPEPMDERITIVGIDEADIQAVGAYPIPDGVLAALLRQLERYDSQIIGLDIFRDLPVEPGHAELTAVFQSMDNLIGAATVVPDEAGTTIAPPPSLPPEQIGFVDKVSDADGHLRRSLLGSPTVDGGYQFSMAIQLAKAYLTQYGIELGNGTRDPIAMRFGDVELPRVHPNSGGYVRVDAGGNQTLLNFRSGTEPFRIVSLMAVLNGQVEPEWLRDRIVLVGVTASSTKDILQSSAVASANPGQVFGVEAHAHATSQIISAVLDGRSLLRTWPDGWEYGWIILWGVAGMGVSQFAQQPGRHFLIVVMISIGCTGLGYVALLNGWWLPVAPALAAFLFNAVVLRAFYLYDRSLQLRIQDRQQVIEQTFTAIHNGPLQTLATLMREVDDPDFARQTLRKDLQQLNQELRNVYATIQQEVVQEQLYLHGQFPLNLTDPLHELLYEVYSDTLRRDFSYFAALKVKVTKFEPFDEAFLSPEQKRDLCRFLEEMLCNVGKHATGATRLMVECRYDGEFNVIRVIDNGVGLSSSRVAPDAPAAALSGLSGRGTQQAQDLAKQLGGTFERSPHLPKGTACILKWRSKTPLPHRIWQKVTTVFGKISG